MERGRGRGRTSTRARGRGRSARPKSARALAFLPPDLNNSEPSISAPQETSLPRPGPSQPNTLAEMVKQQKAIQARDKKNLTHLSAEAKNRLLALREQKQTSRFMLPDAPAEKRKRNHVSPPRVACPLLPNVPEVPPPPTPKPWQQNVAQNQAFAVTSSGPRLGWTGPARCPSEPASPVKESTYLDGQFGILKNISTAAAADPTLASAVDIAPSIEEPISSLPTHLYTPTTQKLRRTQFSPSTGIVQVANANEIEGDILDVEVELFSFTPASTVGDKAPAQSENSEERPSHNREVNIFDEDDEDDIGAWERRILEENPGSDIDDIEETILDSDIINITQRRGIASCPDLNSLPIEVMEILRETDNCDDVALRALSGGDLDPSVIAFNWSGNEETFTGERETFTGTAGPTFNKDQMTPFEVFRKIFDDGIIDIIVRETNRYAYQLKSKYPDLRMLKKWLDVTPAEIWSFFSVIMLQSIHPIPVEREYWHPCLSYLKVGDFNNIMPYKRFLQIKKCLHFVDNESLVGVTGENAKLKKIWPIICHLNDKFCKLYLPEQNIAIDESLLLWKGRLSFAQLIATKSARVGIKSYELCESRTGYLWKMIMYTGKGDKHSEKEPINVDEPEGATSQIVYELVRPLLDKGHTIVMDNFYNSPLLSRTLKRRKTDTMGTLRLNREFVPDF